MMKSTKIFPLIAVLGLYLMSNSLNSMVHFTSLPEVFGLCNICFIGCYVGISIVWAWKYGRSLLAVVTNARTSFSCHAPSPFPPRWSQGEERDSTGTLYLLFQTLVALSLITISKYRIQKYKIKLPP